MEPPRKLLEQTHDYAWDGLRRDMRHIRWMLTVVLLELFIFLMWLCC